MAVIDIHNHVTPRRFVRRDRGATASGTRSDADVGELHIPKFSIPAEERIAEMDEMGVDVHVLTINTGFFKYDLPAGRRPRRSPTSATRSSPR